MVKYSLEQLLEKRLSGWSAHEWVFLPIGNYSFLSTYTIVEKQDDYSGLHGMSVMIVCDGKTANEAYSIADKALLAGALNLAIWHIKLPHIAELVFHGHRYQTPRVLPIDPQWADSVKKLSEVA